MNPSVYTRSVPEAETQAAIVQYLQWRGWLVRETSQRQYVERGLIGLPDVIAFRRGVTAFIEVKKEHAKLRESQVAFARDIEPHLCETLLYYVIYSIDEAIAFEDFI
jgi:hypothetical protein